LALNQVCTYLCRHELHQFILTGRFIKNVGTYEIINQGFVTQNLTKSEQAEKLPFGTSAPLRLKIITFGENTVNFMISKILWRKNWRKFGDCDS
jgi:hypothetical protein